MSWELCNDTHLDGWMGELIDGQMDGWAVGWMGRWMDVGRWMDGWMDGWGDGWMGELMAGWVNMFGVKLSIFRITV